MQDLKMFQIPADFKKISEMSKFTFKKLVKEKSVVASLKYLNKLKMDHSKMDKCTKISRYRPT